MGWPGAIHAEADCLMNGAPFMGAGDTKARVLYEQYRGEGGPVNSKAQHVPLCEDSQRARHTEDRGQCQLCLSQMAIPYFAQG